MSGLGTAVLLFHICSGSKDVVVSVGIHMCIVPCLNVYDKMSSYLIVGQTQRLTVVRIAAPVKTLRNPFQLLLKLVS